MNARGDEGKGDVYAGAVWIHAEIWDAVADDKDS